MLDPSQSLRQHFYVRTRRTRRQTYILARPRTLAVYPSFRCRTELHPKVHETKIILRKNLPFSCMIHQKDIHGCEEEFTRTRSMLSSHEYARKTQHICFSQPFKEYSTTPRRATPTWEREGAGAAFGKRAQRPLVLVPRWKILPSCCE